MLLRQTARLLNSSSLLITHTKSRSRTLTLIRCSYLAYGYHSSRTMATLHGRLRGTSFGILRFKTGPLVKAVDATSRTPCPSRKMDRAFYLSKSSVTKSTLQGRSPKEPVDECLTTEVYGIRAGTGLCLPSLFPSLQICPRYLVD